MRAGLAFFLVEKLLKPGGWIAFDDIYWFYAKSPTMKDKQVVREMPLDQQITPQVEKVFSLLVAQHENFVDLQVKNDWGWARKKENDDLAVRTGVKLDARAFLKRVLLKLRTWSK